MPSATQHPQPVEQFLREDCEAQRVIGPLPESVLPCLHFNRFGVIPKSTPRKWRLILDLSFPQGASVNDGISPDICHLQLASVDDTVQLILELGLLHLVKYIDDFLVAGSAGSPACQSSVTEMRSVCEELGLPLAMEKLEGPAQVITFLGIELDSANMQICLPWAKLLRLQAELCKWSDRKACRKTYCH